MNKKQNDLPYNEQAFSIGDRVFTYLVVHSVGNVFHNVKGTVIEVQDRGQEYVHRYTYRVKWDCKSWFWKKDIITWEVGHGHMSKVL